MGAINGLNLDFQNGSILSGAAFKLSSAAPVTFERTSGIHRAMLQRGANWIVVERQTAATSLDVLLQETYEPAQQLLDLMATEHRHFLALPSAHKEHILWHRPSGRTSVRLKSSVFQSLGIEMMVEMRDANGKLVPQAPPPTQWHEAMRYFRYSQIRDDVYVAYRDAFLGLESVLSHLFPINPGERDVDWLLRACRNLQATGFDFTSFVAVPAADGAQAFVDEQFRANRTAVFHAKQSRPHVVPGNLADRQTVNIALDFLGRFLAEVVRRTFAPGSTVPVFTVAAFQRLIRPIEHDLVLAVSEDLTPVRPTDTTVSPLGKSVTFLETRYEGPVNATGYDYSFLGSNQVENMQSYLIGTIASSTSEDLFSRGNIQELSLEGADDFEFQLVVSFGQRARLQADFEL